jgi:acyl-CoA thioester hydrolase
MNLRESIVLLRVRYSETDQMGTFYNARALEWFECGRTEHLRERGLPYTLIEARGICFPLIEAHLEFKGRARYDDPLKVITTSHWVGRARLRFDETIVHAETNRAVVSGYTIHAVTDAAGIPKRPPAWITQLWQEGQHHEPNRSETSSERQ